MSLFFHERVEEKIDDRASDKKIVFTFPWIFIFPFQEEEDHWMVEETAAETRFTTTYKMAATHWNVFLRTDDSGFVVSNANEHEEWNGICYISYTLYYDENMRFELYSSTRIRMTEFENGQKFQTPAGYLTKFVEGMNNKKFSKCVVFVELHIPTKYFYEPLFNRINVESKILDQFPDDYENDFRFQFMKNGDYIFECLDGTVPAQRVILYTSSETMKKQLSSPLHYSVGTVLYTVDVIEPIITFFHSHYLKLPEQYSFDYIQRLLSAIEFFEPNQKWDMKKKVEELLCQKFVKETPDFNSLILWLSFSCKSKFLALSKMIYSFIANEHYFKWQHKFPLAAGNADNQFSLPLMGGGHVFQAVEYIHKQTFFTNIILQ